jgi:hypothetical protein
MLWSRSLPDLIRKAPLLCVWDVAMPTRDSRERATYAKPVSRQNAQLSLYLLIKHSAMKTCKGVYVFLTSALRGEWSASGLILFTPCTHWIWGWVDSQNRSGWRREGRTIQPLPGLEIWPLCLSARSRSLYRLSHPGSRRTVNSTQ